MRAGGIWFADMTCGEATDPSASHAQSGARRPVKCARYHADGIPVDVGHGDFRSAGRHKPQRKAATRFRKFLLDQGFLMSQFSVYMRFCGGKDQAEAYTKRIQRALPKSGLVQILFFTDQQYESIISFEGRAQAPPHENPEQYMF